MDADRFIFDAAGFGQDVGTDWLDGTDIFEMRGMGLSFGEVIAAQTGGNVILTFTGLAGDRITLISETTGNIDASDFFF